MKITIYIIRNRKLTQNTYGGIQFIQYFDEPTYVEEGPVGITPVGLMRYQYQFVQQGRRMIRQLLKQLLQLFKKIIENLLGVELTSDTATFHGNCTFW